MSHYVKLFGSILQSTIWQTTSDTRVVWITLMAMADRDGVIEASIPGLAKMAGVCLADCEQALTAFLSPDPYSRTKDFEGRRLEEIEGGWRLLNHDKYREKQNLAERRQKDAERQRRKRDKSRDSVTRTVTSTNVHLSDTDTDTELKTPVVPFSGDRARRRKAKPDPVETYREQAEIGLAALNAARKRIRPSVHGYGVQAANLKHIAGRLAAGYSLDDVHHVIAVREAECRARPGSFQWFNAESPFREDNFTRALGGDPQQRIFVNGETARAEPKPIAEVIGAFKDDLR